MSLCASHPPLSLSLCPWTGTLQRARPVGYAPARPTLSFDWLQLLALIRISSRSRPDTPPRVGPALTRTWRGKPSSRPHPCPTGPPQPHMSHCDIPGVSCNTKSTGEMGSDSSDDGARLRPGTGTASCRGGGHWAYQLCGREAGLHSVSAGCHVAWRRRCQSFFSAEALTSRHKL